jgi:hypothetical protein
VPSGEKALPPTFTVVEKLLDIANGELAVFCWPSTLSVAVSYKVNPAMKLAPSGAMESVLDWPVTVRPCRTVPEAAS